MFALLAEKESERPSFGLGIFSHSCSSSSSSSSLFASVIFRFQHDHHIHALLLHVWTCCLSLLSIVIIIFTQMNLYSLIFSFFFHLLYALKINLIAKNERRISKNYSTLRYSLISSHSVSVSGGRNEPTGKNSEHFGWQKRCFDRCPIANFSQQQKRQKKRNDNYEIRLKETKKHLLSFRFNWITNRKWRTV